MNRKLLRLIDGLVIGQIVGALIAMIFIAKAGWGQTPTPMPDRPLLKIGENYTMGCTPTDPQDLVVQACYVRVDVTPIVELGCVDAAPNTTAHLDFALALTAGEKAEIKCYVVSSYGVPSDYSSNSGIVDFTKPGRPFVPLVP